MRTLTLVPVGEERRLPPDGVRMRGPEPAPHTFFLERADAALDERDATVRADRSEALADGGAATFAPIRSRPELLPAVRELVGGLGIPEERGGPRFVEPCHPRGDRDLGDEESRIGRLSRRPAAGRAEFRKREAFHRRIVATATDQHALDALVLDAEFLAEQGEFVLQPGRFLDAICSRGRRDACEGEA